jgi:hypothetical protein
MISDAPVMAAGGEATLMAQVAAFLEVAKAKAAGGITWSEFGELLVALLRLSVETLDAVLGMSGAEKKSLVLEAVAALFDTLADKAVPVVVWPVWILARPAIRALVLAIASGAIEIVLPLTRAAE